ncbi:MAG: hypothetical protein OER80_03475 [Gammaproteobacteria bacterium]|nr:hypothetical protein [Gammaproteobacteria bacterium]MDH3766889.1 hypothetical protein [Gammaproteobacteria bacterium]
MIWPFSKRASRDSRIGIALDPLRGGSVAVIERLGSRLRLRHRGTCAAPADGDWHSGLSALLGEHHEPLNAVASDGTYQLLLVDRPNVPDAEIAAAVRWKIREFMTTEVDDSVVDIFDVPPQARGSRNMVYAVASQSESVKQLAHQIRGCGVPLESIDIAELCMRNIATQLEQDRFGIAFLLIRGHQGLLTVTRDKILYVIRQMEIPSGIDDAALSGEAMSGVALELQRSLDYFESHYDQRPIRDVVLAPSADGISHCAALAEELAVNVSLLDLNEILETPDQLTPQEQSDCLLAIGAALRGPDIVELAA